MNKLTIACAGCGSRGRTYLTLAAEMNSFEIVAGADPVPDRVGYVKKISNNPAFRSFTTASELLSEPRLADVLLVATQDADHFHTCMAALDKGYDILVEKPIATCIEHVLQIEKKATELGRRVMVCHVLRYTPFYRKVKEIVSNGELGEIISVNMSEGVGAFHQAHSFVRGHWGVKEKSAPMIIAKSCHDLDILCWLLETECKRVSSYGDLSYFTEKNKPADAPLRCTDGCPAADSCKYNAEFYTTTQKGWLRHVWPLFDNDNPPKTDEILEWLKTSQWGRCVFQCDNNVVDHQTVNMEFENRVTATFTMTAFDHGRNIEIFGTEGVLRGGETVKDMTGSEITVKKHLSDEYEKYSLDKLEGGYEGHGGGDQGLVKDLYTEMTCENLGDMQTSINVSAQSHLIGFAAEESRLSGTTLELEKYRSSLL